PNEQEYCGFSMRIMLDDQGNVLTNCLENQCSSFFAGGAAEAMTPSLAREGLVSTPDKWTTFRWVTRPQVGIPAGAWCRIDETLPPLRWFFEAGADLADRIARRHNDFANNVPTATWLDAAAYTAFWNISLAKLLNVLPPELQILAANIPENQ